MLPQNNPDGIRIVFDDYRLLASAGLLLPATLTQHLGLGKLLDHHLDLGCAPVRANTGDKLLTLVASALAGGDCIDDADALRAGEIPPQDDPAVSTFLLFLPRKGSRQGRQPVGRRPDVVRCTS